MIIINCFWFIVDSIYKLFFFSFSFFNVCCNYNAKQEEEEKIYVD